MTVRANNTHIIFSDGTTQSTVGISGAESLGSGGSSLFGPYVVGIPWQINTAMMSSKLNMATHVTTGLFFKPDGSKMYTTSHVTQTVVEYDLSTAWQSNTATEVGSKSSSPTTTPKGLAFDDTGTRMYLMGSEDDRIYQYSLTTAWQVNTATLVANVSVAGSDSSPTGLSFSSDGNYVYFCGISSGDVFRWNMSTPWSIATATASQTLSSVEGTQSLGELRSCVISANGHKLYVGGSTGTSVASNNYTNVLEYNLSTPYSLSGATVASNNMLDYSFTGQDNQWFVGVTTNAISSMYFKSDGERLFTGGQSISNGGLGNWITEWNLESDAIRIRSIKRLYGSMSSNATHIIIS